MKVLLDTCVWGGAKAALEAAEHDVVWTGDWPQDPGDEEIMRNAHGEARVLVTLDKDFGELAIVRGVPHFGLVRLVGIRARDQGSLCCILLDRYGDVLARGAVVTAEPGRVRVREPQV